MPVSLSLLLLLPRAQELVKEIKILSSYRHEHIVAYLGSAVFHPRRKSEANPNADGASGASRRLQIVMEYIPCGSLLKVPACPGS